MKGNINLFQFINWILFLFSVIFFCFLKFESFNFFYFACDIDSAIVFKVVKWMPNSVISEE